MQSINPPTITKRLWHIMQIVYYMLRKNISKRKLILDLQFLLKHGKLAKKAVANLLTTFHHHHRRPHANPNEVEFSCSNTPSYPTTKKKSYRRRSHHRHDSFDAADIAVALQMMNAAEFDAEELSALPTPSPMMVRQLRITDSPFPLEENEVVDVGMIDKKAENFIKWFYDQLMMQQSASESVTPDYDYRRRRTITGN